MKKYLIPLILLMILAGTSCEEKIDIEKEKEEIKAVIENESNSFLARDFNQQSKSFMQDESLVMLAATNYEYFYHVGWEKISSVYKYLYEENPESYESHFTYTNYNIKVYDASAIAYYDEIAYDYEGKQIRKNISVRFLEKAGGEWKIVYLSFVNTTSYEHE